MKEKVAVNFLDNMSFEALVNGHKIYLDASSEHGGKNLGPRPKPLLLVALAGCTGMDVVSILKKMRVEFDDFNIAVEADSTEEHPKVYTKMTLIYEFTGKDLPLDKLQKAIELSRERYCGVSAMFSKAMDLDYKINVKDV